jgi:hypothetical protein
MTSGGNRNAVNADLGDWTDGIARRCLTPSALCTNGTTPVLTRPMRDRAQCNTAQGRSICRNLMATLCKERVNRSFFTVKSASNPRCSSRSGDRTERQWTSACNRKIVTVT